MHGETRRDRNECFGVESPALRPPESGRQIWEWYEDAVRTRRYDDGKAQLLTPEEWMSWAKIRGFLVRREEFAVLMDMDRCYVGALRKEKQDQQQREIDRLRSKK